MSSVVPCGRVILLIKDKLKTLKNRFNIWDRLRYPLGGIVNQIQCVG